MTVEEKLLIFRETASEDAESRSRKELAAYRASLQESFKEHSKTRRAEAEARIQEETVRLRREETFRVSEYRQESRRELAAKEKELSGKLFGLVEEKLAACRKSPVYREYLIRKVREAKAFAGEDEMQIFLDAEDSQYFSLLEKESGVRPEVSPKKLGGGLRVLLPGRRICLENAWNALLAEARASFRFEGGPEA